MHSKHNEDAKIYNRNIPSNYHLRALRHPKTNEPIENFPLTLDEIEIMPGELPGIKFCCFTC